MKNSNLELRKECCKGCRCDGNYCVYREELDESIGKKFKKDGTIYIKTCTHFEFD